MTKFELKQQERTMNKLMTVREATKFTDKKIEETKRIYDNFYTIAMVNTLNGGFGFGKKRLLEVLKIFFEQVEGLVTGTIEAEDMMKVAEKAGVKIQYIDGVFTFKGAGE